MDVDLLKELFTYDDVTGVVKNRVTRNHSAKAGEHVGFANGNGYLRTGVNGRQIYIHQIAWALGTGAWPTKVIDHINGNPLDNRLINLRECSHSENARNSPKRSHSRNPYKGVRRSPWSDNKWVSRIRFQKREIFLGVFTTAEEAYEAYCAAAVKFHGEFARFA